jgi:ribonuclease BN (tRNA processing enzyme)
MSIDKKNKTRLCTSLSSWRDTLIEYKTPNGILRGPPQYAAKHTTFILDGMCLDAGWVPQDVKIRLLLLTHMHSDHARDVMNVVNGNENLTILCPASVAIDLFKMIQLNITIQKGRRYSNIEISKLITIYGCKKSNECKYEIESDMNIKYITIGKMIRVELKGQKVVEIEHFACCHTVDTVGYMIYEIRKCLSKQINIPVNSTYTINTTDDQKNDNNQSMKKFNDVKDFSRKYDIELHVSVYPKILENGHTLYQRLLQFKNEFNIPTYIDNKCIFSKSDFIFFKKYKINIRDEIKLPQVMFFGDTSARVFENKRVLKLIRNAKTVIIESTFLETPEELGNKKYREHKKKRHMFLHELVPIMNNNIDTQFILCHFSACYDKTTILERINSTGCSNVKAFV